ncbi:MAG: succinate dehydrogenase cytochrome b subunit [Prolixibacteraceae bacterium]|nr:succinate dehydrogenase cytochrome b subunit [Prolixibacteraceae bacterium]MBN2773678.1 succinate dehydrogenase cytochrome b subunit [Prolixibacteraceae bacterium]
MSKFLTASIGKKFIMSITGIFLMMFILVHLTINLLLIFDDTGELFNKGAHFMATNPVIKIVEPLLGLGFMIHILWSFVISYQNWRARPIRYAKSNPGESSTWASRNMLILGALVLVFLVTHIINFFWIIKFAPDSMESINGTNMENTYKLVSELFIESIPYCIVYIIGAILLGLHLTHGFWSAFQTLGLNNKNWMKRLEWIAKIYAVIVAVGFSVIPLYFMLVK